MIHLHSGYIFGKYVSEGMKPQPLPPNTLYENGVFNSLYIPNGFNILTNRSSIDHGPPYQPSTGTWYQIYDYDLDDFTFPDGSLTDGSTFNLTIHGDSLTQQQLNITTSSIKMTHIRPRYLNITKSVFTGFIIPINDFISFLNMSPYSYRAIYVRYRILNSNVYRKFLSGEVGHSTSPTTMTTEKSLSTIYISHISDNNWHDEDIWNTRYKGHIIDLDPDNSYFLKFGYITDINSYQEEMHTTLEINKIWSDEYDPGLVN